MTKLLKPLPTEQRAAKPIRRKLLFLGMILLVTIGVVVRDQVRNELRIANESAASWTVSKISLRPEVINNDVAVDSQKSSVVLIENEVFPPHKELRLPFQCFSRATFDIWHGGDNWTGHSTAFLLPSWGNRIIVVEKNKGVHEVMAEKTPLRKWVESHRWWIPLPPSLLD